MKILVGLGNPGPKYHYTRHNAGFLFLDHLVEQWGTAEPKFTLEKKFTAEIYTLHPKPYTLILAKPTTFMNASGVAVKKILAYYDLKPETDLVLIHDDLDIDFGRFKIQKDKGPRAHNGIDSVVSQLGTSDFTRVRVGVAGKTLPLIKQKSGPIAEDYLLKPFSKSELVVLPDIFTQVISEFTNLLKV